MDLRKLVEKYVDAWSRQDVDGVLELMHKGAAYYDAFWMETCVGKDLADYFSAAFEEENYSYKIVGDLIEVNGGVAYRYGAYDRDEPNSPSSFLGMDVLIIQDGKILTASDFYCSPRKQDLEEVCRLAAKRHGIPRYAEGGLGASKSAAYRRELAELMDHEQLFLDPDLTALNVAERLGCTAEQLAEVLRAEFQLNFGKFLSQRRARYAHYLLKEDSDDPNLVSRVGDMVGFRSADEFAAAFRSLFGVSPADFHRNKDVNLDTANGFSSN